jgi:TonB family protein
MTRLSAFVRSLLPLLALLSPLVVCAQDFHLVEPDPNSYQPLSVRAVDGESWDAPLQLYENGDIAVFTGHSFIAASVQLATLAEPGRYQVTIYTAFKTDKFCHAIVALQRYCSLIRYQHESLTIDTGTKMAQVTNRAYLDPQGYLIPESWSDWPGGWLKDMKVQLANDVALQSVATAVVTLINQEQQRVSLQVQLQTGLTEPELLKRYGCTDPNCINARIINENNFRAIFGRELSPPATAATPTPPASPTNVAKNNGPAPSQQYQNAYKAAVPSLKELGPGVSPPKAIYTPDPEYTPEARKANLRGRAILYCVVGTDGRLHDIHVERALGKGLDEQAVATLQKWTFQPAIKDGQPVPVRINVEVQFQLCSGYACKPY